MKFVSLGYTEIGKVWSSMFDYLIAYAELVLVEKTIPARHSGFFYTRNEV